jgi:hypothetical protein
MIGSKERVRIRLPNGLDISRAETTSSIPRFHTYYRSGPFSSPLVGRQAHEELPRGRASVSGCSPLEFARRDQEV